MKIQEIFKTIIFFIYEFNMFMSIAIIGLMVNVDFIMLISSIIIALVSFYAYIYIFTNSISRNFTKKWWASKFIGEKFKKGVDEIFHT